MSSAFLSYDSDDLQLIKPLADALTAQGVTVLRDKDNLYSQQNWPKVLGEAIASHDFFLLAWSKNAAECQFVKFEWNTAIALEKKIIACFLDKSPLPESLRSVQQVPWDDSDISSMLAVLKTDAMRKAELLDHIKATDPSEVLEQTKAIFGLDALVERMKVKNRDDLFVIGAGERRITLYSQQVRALNLVYWLWRRNPENFSKKHIMVVGGGAAGLSIAAAAAHLGSRVTILEGNERTMAFQLGCRTRLFHPHVYEWPERFCWKMSAGLPILDWDEGSAGEVAGTIRRQFEVIRQATTPRITLIDSVSSISIELPAETQDKPVIRWKEPRISKQPDPDITELVLAVGFGVEKTVPGLPLLSYWRDDPLEQAAFLREGKQHQQLIAGNGDGALTDLLRASLWDFDHANFFSSLAPIMRSSDLEKKVLQEEHEFFQKTQQGEDVSSQLESFYENLATENRDTIAEVDELLRTQLRKNYSVIWLHSDPICWKPDSMPLNRFLVSRLLRLPLTPLKTECGTLLTVEPSQSEGFNYDACIRNPDGTRRLPVHGVTVRIGVEPALQSLSSIWKKLSEEQQGKKLFKYRLPDERPTPDKFWERDGKSGILFLEKFSKSNLLTGGGAIRNTKLCVKLAPDKDENPIREKTQKGQQLIYRLIVYLRCVPAEVRRVTYDLHPPLEREKCDAKELRKERLVVLEPPSLWEDGEDKELFKKLVHTDSDYTVRVRLDNGEEFIDRLACGLCRHYQNHPEDKEGISVDPKVTVKALLHEHPCHRRDRFPVAHCLLIER